jgi:hypothetical protein
MTEKQFNQLQIGDKVMNNTLTGETTVVDINRQDGTINTGGPWRKFNGVHLADPTKPQNYTVLEPVTHVTLSIIMLRRYSLLEAVLVQTILRAGTEGFIGTNETLCDATQLCRSLSTFNTIISRLIREGIIMRENLAGKASRYTINLDKAKQYL